MFKGILEDITEEDTRSLVNKTRNSRLLVSRFILQESVLNLLRKSRTGKSTEVVSVMETKFQTF